MEAAIQNTGKIRPFSDETEKIEDARASSKTAEIIREVRLFRAAASRAEREAQEWLAAPEGSRRHKRCLSPMDFVRFASTPFRCYRRDDGTVLLLTEWLSPDVAGRFCRYVGEEAGPNSVEKGIRAPGASLLVLAGTRGGGTFTANRNFSAAEIRVLWAWTKTTGPDTAFLRSGGRAALGGSQACLGGSGGRGAGVTPPFLCRANTRGRTPNKALFAKRRLRSMAAGVCRGMPRGPTIDGAAGRLLPRHASRPSCAWRWSAPRRSAGCAGPGSRPATAA